MFLSPPSDSVVAELHGPDGCTFEEHIDELVATIRDAFADNVITFEEGNSIVHQLTGAIEHLLTCDPSNPAARKEELITVAESAYDAHIRPLKITNLPLFLKPMQSTIEQTAHSFLRSNIRPIVETYISRLLKTCEA